MTLVEEDGKEPVLDVQAGYGDPSGFEGREYLVKSDPGVVRVKLEELDGSEKSFVDPLSDQSDLFKEMLWWVGVCVVV